MDVSFIGSGSAVLAIVLTYRNRSRSKRNCSEFLLIALWVKVDHQCKMPPRNNLRFYGTEMTKYSKKKVRKVIL